MKKKYNSLIKNIGLFTIGSIGSKIITFLLLPLYTSILNTSDYGKVDLIQTTAQLLIPILLLSIQDATLRFSMDPKYKKEDVLSTTININIKGSLILIIGLIIAYSLNIFDYTIEYFIFLFLAFILGSLNNCFNLYLKAKDKASVIAISGILCTIVTCLANILLLVTFKCGIMGYMISIVLGLLIQMLYQLIYGEIYKDFHIKKYNDLSKEMTTYSAPLIANSVAWWVNNASDRYIIKAISGIAANGIYAVAYKIPTILTTFQGIFYNAWSISAISEFDKDDSDGFIGNNYMIYSFLSIIVCSVLLLLNIPIAKILYSNEFYNAWTCVPFLLVGTVFNGISQLEGSLFAATKKTKEVSKTTVIGALINIIFNLIFISWWGIIGAAFATMIGYLITWILRSVKLSSFIKMKVNWKNHILSIIILIIQSILATLNNYYILQIICIVAIIILHWNYIYKVMNTIEKVLKKA